MVNARNLTEAPLGVFTEGWPGLQVNNLELLNQPIGSIDWHAPPDPKEARRSLTDLVRNVLTPRKLKLDAVVFGLAGESYADPQTARDTVGFAAPGSRRRAERFRYTKTLVELVSEVVPASLFVRGRTTLKGHFGAFDRENTKEFAHLLACLKSLKKSTLSPKNVLMLSETGCEPAKDVNDFLLELGTDTFGANWDTANLSLWGVSFDTLDYGRELAAAGTLRGVHFKGGQAPTTPGTWGFEVDPSPELVAAVLSILARCQCFDGALTVEREKFLGEQRETQAEKAAGLSATLQLILQWMSQNK